MTTQGPGRDVALRTASRNPEERSGSNDSRKKSAADRTKISGGGRRRDRCRIAAIGAPGRNSNGRPFRAPARTSRRTALPLRVTSASYRTDPTGSTNAYATASGGSASIGRESSRSAKPTANPATAVRRTREKRYPTNPRVDTRVRRNDSMGQRRGLAIRRHVAAISAARSTRRATPRGR